MLLQTPIAPWMKPQGGMFLWMRLPHGLDSARVSHEALHQGNVFNLSQTAAPFLRFNVAQCHAPKIFGVPGKEC